MINDKRALEYLCLDINQRINWRAEVGLSISEWYESFKPEPHEKSHYPIKESARLLNTDGGVLYRRLENDKEAKNSFVEGKGFTKDYLYSLLYRVAYSVRTNDARDALIEAGLKAPKFLRESKFDEECACYNLSGTDGYAKLRLIGLVDFARIVYEQRIEMHKEQWPGVPELRALTGRSRDTVENMIGDGVVKAEKVRLHSTQRGNPHAHKIHPTEFRRFSGWYERQKQLVEQGVSPREYSAAAGFRSGNVYGRIRSGKIKATSIPPGRGLSTKGNSGLIIAPEELERLESVEGILKSGDTRQESLEMLLRYYGGDAYLPKATIRRLREFIPSDFTGFSTNGMVPEDVLNAYVDIHDPATLGEEVKLWALAREGNQEAFIRLKELYTESIKRSAAKWYKEMGFDDKFEFGLSGLWSAVNEALYPEKIRSFARVLIKTSILRSGKAESRPKNHITYHDHIALSHHKKFKQ